MSNQTAKMGRPRSPMFRALGKLDPPERIEVGCCHFERVEILKHDSWAATAVYRCDDRKIVCKFNRQQPIFGLPMRWLGRTLARQESTMLQRLGDLPGIPAWSGTIRHHGKLLDFAVAHEFIEGHPLGADERRSPDFFDRLRSLLVQIHRRDIAYVDLHKRENVIVGNDGLPYLIDFQISFRFSKSRLFAESRELLDILQQADLYHVEKLRLKHCLNASPEALQRIQPLFIRLHRLIALPFRRFRRSLLVRLGFRTGRGNASSEFFAEDAVRREQLRVISKRVALPQEQHSMPAAEALEPQKIAA